MTPWEKYASRAVAQVVRSMVVRAEMDAAVGDVLVLLACSKMPSNT